ncbi:cytochrome c oxidase subunit 3 [Buchnera aphidicola]|uniref:Cytochrome bo(3) ubiquinol oxidase subunit 3 n=1 Tax=Buchnera aphidicola (Cinara strobi) TaxID=1921549 RepID=A0A3B1DM24_9GAMM|nr:cytochrome c oxidase subunit 3 [Buchnera aphidicola]VAX76731.1 Cytochrome bo(3) ubiquinol oxidase subunit 3 [Buchnera aphidicola (Cinara strobi)]
MNNKKNDISYGDLSNINILGFWIYLMSDLIIFSVLFIVHIIMSRHGYHGFLRENNLFSWSLLFLETTLLSFSALSCNISKYFFRFSSKKYVIFFLLLTLILGGSFLGLEVYECLNIFNHGFYPSISGYLSSLFVLIGIHGLHIIFGLSWILILIYQVYQFGFNSFVKTSLICFSLFWHFIDIIWIVLIFCVYFN